MKLKTNYNITIYSLIIAIYFLSLPLGALNLGPYGSLLKYIGFIVLLSWLFFSRKIFINKILIAELTLFFLFLISIIYSIDIEMTFSRNLTNISFILLIICISGLPNNNINNKLIINSALWASRITAFIFLISADIYKGSGRFSLSGVFLEDPNYLTGYFIFGFVFSLFNSLYSKQIKNRIIGFFEGLLYLYIILLTGSRTGLITFIIIIILIYIFGNKFKINNIYRIIPLILTFVFLYIFTLNFLSQDLLSRFTIESIIKSEGVGRFELWYRALTIFYNSNLFRMFFGYGNGTIFAVYSIFGYPPSVAHNMFIEIFIENGLIGLFVYVYVIILLINSTLNLTDKRLFYVLLGMIILSIATSMYSFKPNWNIILIIVYFKNKFILKSKVN